MIKLLNPDATFKVVSQSDESVENESAEELAVLIKEGKGTRFDNYIKSFDLSDLKFKEGSSPSPFVVRCIKADELAEMNEKYLEFDPEKRRVTQRNRNKMLLDIFEKCVQGIEIDGSMHKVNKDMVGYNVALEIGSMISIMTTIGHNLKKQ